MLADFIIWQWVSDGRESPTVAKINLPLEVYYVWFKKVLKDNSMKMTLFWVGVIWYTFIDISEVLVVMKTWNLT